MDHKQLMNLKDEIDQAKTAVAELNGRKKSLLIQLRELFQCQSLEEAEIKVVKLRKQIERLDNQIAIAIGELEQKLKSDGSKDD